MAVRKQQLLKKHRKQKRLTMLFAFIVLIAAAVFWQWYVLPLGLLVLWLVHEAWFSDHLFYSAKEDYQYSFPSDTQQWSLSLAQTTLFKRGQCIISEFNSIKNNTLILEVNLNSNLLGRFFDPSILLNNDSQHFELGAKGVRYLNITGQEEVIKIRARFCKIDQQATLYAFAHEDFTQKNMMILAPHADDAELAAFGLYSEAEKVSIVTLTQGEIEAKNYQAMLDISLSDAAALKGRLRSWDSLAIPLWGGVAQNQCVQLGYYCLQLPAMAQQPEVIYGSKESGEQDIRTVRHHNPISLPADADGLATWNNLLADLSACLEHFQPDVVIMPHPEIDPHADHIATGKAFFQALERSTWKVKTLLFYANHLHDNDRWPMGNVHTGVALPPSMVDLPAYPVYSHVLSKQQQVDKAMALAMQHDLQTKLPFKKRLRRAIQTVLVGRHWPKTGDSDFMRKAVRKHEVFWRREL